MTDARPRRSSYYLWIAIPILTTLNQACLRLLAMRMKETAFGWRWIAEAAHTPWLAGIALCEGVGFALWLSILADTDLGKATLITSIAYVLILLMSWTIFKEPVAPLQMIGSVLVLSGVWLIGTASRENTSSERTI